MNALLQREFKECVQPARIGYHFLTLIFMGFILWNFESHLAFFARLYGEGFAKVMLLMPSYLVLFFAMMMLRNFILEKKLGVLEAILATGVDKSSLALSRTASIFAVSTVQTFLTLLFFEMLARKNLGASLLDFYGSPDGILLSVNLLLLAAAWIWALVALLLIYSAVANYLLLLAFGLMFLYAGFYHILKAANAWLCCVFFAAMIAASMISAARFLRNAPNDRVIAE